MKKNKAIFIFPFAGGSSYSMKGLIDGFKDIDVFALEAPGRGKRYKEKLLTNIYEIVDMFYLEIKDKVENYDEYYFFGHSMGSLVGYLLIHKIITNKVHLPSYFFVSGRGGPSMEPDCKNYFLLPSVDFRNKLREFGGCPDEILNDNDLMDFFEPILRADFEAVETFVYEKKEILNIPITGFYGSDEETTKTVMDLWQVETNRTIEIFEIQGNHFFIYENWPTIIKTIRNKIFN
jgi:surfactin synthase thioesterase subunit